MPSNDFGAIAGPTGPLSVTGLPEETRNSLARILPMLIAARMGGSQIGGLQTVQSEDPIAVLAKTLGGPALEGQTGSFGRAVGIPPNQGYAPSGPNINFFGGSPFPYPDRQQGILSGLVIGSRVLEAINTKREADKKAQKEAEAARKRSQGGS